MQIERRLNATTVVRVTGETEKDVFEALIAAEQVFGEQVCGACKTAGAKLRKKQVREYTFYEAVCQNQNCKAVLTFFCGKDGKMFPNRKDKNKEWLPNNGWVIFKPTGTSANGAASQSQEPAREPQDYSQENEVPF